MSDWYDQLDADCEDIRKGCIRFSCKVQGVRPGKVQCDGLDVWHGNDPFCLLNGGVDVRELRQS